MATSAAPNVLQALGAQDPRWIGDYRLRAVIGQGGMGRVYLGELAHGGRPAAIKTIKADHVLDAEFRERFAREVVACRKLGGHCTPAVQDYSLDGLRPWLAIDYVKAPTLKDLVKESGPLPVPAAMALVRELARILVRLNELRLVHRDLKPSNVLVTPDGPSMIDFGLVRDITRPSGSLTTPRGTAGYVSPEQVRNRGVGGATDVYALGGVLAFAVTGEDLPLSDNGVMVARRPDGSPDMAELPADVRELVDICMVQDASRRISARALMDRADRLALAAQGLGIGRTVTGLGALAWLPEGAQEVLRRYENVLVPQAPADLPAGPPPHRPPTKPTPPLPPPPTGPLAATRIAPRWSHRLPGPTYYATPLPHRGRLLVAALDGTVQALDCAGGRPVWTRAVGARVECTLAAVGETVIVPCADRAVYALDLGTGATLWRHSTGNTAPSTPSATESLICLGDREGVVTVLEPGSGRVRWRASAGSRAVLGAPAVREQPGTVYAAAWDHYLYAFDATDGTRLWRAPTGGELQGGPVVAGDTVLVGSGDRHVYAFDAASGTQRWRFRTEGRVIASPAVQGELVWVGCSDGGLYALSLTDAKVLHRYPVGAAIRATPTPHGQCVYVAGQDGVVHVVQGHTGRHWPWFEADGPIDSAVAVADGLVYVGSADGRVHAVEVGAGRTHVLVQDPCP
ncbi:PQQ-binding-like beta-propeller repeat protein [Streptomyces sp. NPDC048751]|uniref:outer membrane protein assembly factor BamB family protein n=1 Tax=Streptomyces sp. NPDC048751 TaxID=3365591 RepID=UPI003711D0F1